MTELFPGSLKLPEGFSYADEFLTVEDEQRLLEALITIELRPMIFHGFEAKRKVASFGYDYHFDNRRLTKGTDTPSSLDWLVSKVENYLSLPAHSIAEVLITEYPVGSVINWHRDAPSFERIVGVSLLSDCVFKLRPHDKAKQTRNATLSLPVRRRSIYVMSGVTREQWQHSTAPVSAVRYSITLRTLR